MATIPSGKKKFEELSERLEKQLECMSPGGAFPGVRAIMREHDISQATAYRAIDILKQRGLIESKENGSLMVAVSDSGRCKNLQVAVMTTRPDSPYRHAMIEAIISLSHEYNMKFTIWPMDEETFGDISELIPTYDAFLVIPGRYPISPQTVAQWDLTKVPVVVLDRQMSNLQIDCVGSNNYFAGLLSARHLVGLGHQKIGVFLHEPAVSTLRERADGFCDEASQHEGVACRVLKSPQMLTTSTDLCDWMKLELIRNQDLTALFALTHTASLALLRTLYSINKRVPEEVSVVGFDNLRSSELACPPMTTLDQEIDEMAQKACELLVERLDAKRSASQQLVIKPRLVIRNSTSSHQPKV